MSWFGTGMEDAKLERILGNHRRIEAKLVALLAALGVETDAPVGRYGLSAEQREQVQSALDRRNKVAAFKAPREFTRLGLAESKDAVERGDF